MPRVRTRSTMRRPCRGVRAARDPRSGLVQKNEPLDLFVNATAPTALNPVDLKNGKPLKAWTSTARNSVPASDGKVVYIGENDGVDEGKSPRLLGIKVDTKNKKYDWELKGPELETLVLSADGSVIAITRDEKKAPGLIEIWETATGKKRTKYQHPFDKESSYSNTIEGLALSPDGTIAISATGLQDNKNLDRTYHAWSTKNGKQLWKLSTAYTDQPCFTSDGKHVLCWYKKGPAVVEAKTGKVVHQYPTNNDGANCDIALTKDDKSVLVYAAEMLPDPEGWQTFLIKIDRDSGKRAYSLKTGGGKFADRMIIMSDGQHVALMSTIADKEVVQIRQISDGSLKTCFRIDEVAVGEDGNFLPDGKSFLLKSKIFEIPNWQ